MTSRFATASAGGSLDRGDPVIRLHYFFNRYEAVTYAVYRTTVMCESM